jgi:hypothetical protein
MNKKERQIHRLGKNISLLSTAQKVLEKKHARRSRVVPCCLTFTAISVRSSFANLRDSGTEVDAHIWRC